MGKKIKLSVVIVLHLFILCMLYGCVIYLPSSSDDSYTLKDESVSAITENYYVYNGVLTNISNTTYEFRITVILFNSEGVSVATEVEYYILASGGTKDVVITLQSNQIPDTYETKVLAILKR